jgi:Raf kinase inhibitor-like YbhB/YbcL family protein
VLLSVLAGGVIVAASQQSPRSLAIERFSEVRAALAVKSSSFSATETIPTRHSDYGEKLSPALSWTAVPSSAKALVLIAEDPDAADPKPFVHWVLYNLPPSINVLPESVPGTPRLPQFGNALQGRNSRGTIGYFGPRPPKGDPPHHYHFQIFAVDTMLDLDPGATTAEVLAAMAGHVVAAGEIVGSYRHMPVG